VFAIALEPLVDELRGEVSVLPASSSTLLDARLASLDGTAQAV
jgi:hypothetical protein